MKDRKGKEEKETLVKIDNCISVFSGPRPLSNTSSLQLSLTFHTSRVPPLGARIVSAY